MLKLKGRFEKEEIRVGLSAGLPLAYDGAEEKYAIVDLIASSHPSHFTYTKDVIRWEMEITSDSPFRSADRGYCYHLISIMPDDALEEVTQELSETLQHYISIEEINRQPKYLPTTKEVSGIVVDRLKT